MSLKRKATDLAADAAKKPKANSAITSFFSQPKPNPPTSSTNPAVPHTNGDAAPGADATQPVKFDKDAWVAKLTPEQKELLKLEIETLHESWLGALKEEVVSKEFLDLKRFLKRELETGKKVFPPSDDIYSWSRHTPLHNVKAVIVGQDPYHNLNQAHGLCFSVRPPTPAPPSLKNMYTALKKDYPDFKAPPKNGGLLTPWADRGVLMLNACLTVRAHEANSHSNKGWEGFTQKVIDVVAKKRTRGVVFLAWGNPAQKRCTRINGQKHLVLKSVHPSPLSASRGFFDCGHFKKANEWLKQRYGEEGMIDWNLDVSPEDADSETYVVTDVGSTDFRATQTYCPNATVSTSTVYGVNQTIITALPASTITVFQAPTSLAPVDTPSAPSSTPYIISGSGFEDGTENGYNTSSSDPEATAVIAKDGPFQPNSGSSYLLITFEGSNPSKVRRQATNQLMYNVTQVFAATTGNSYTLTVYAAKSQSDDVEPQCSLTICAEDSCGNAQPLSTTYSQISYQYTASSTNANAIASFIVQCSRAAYVALDDISISSTSAIPSSAQNGVSTVLVTRTLTIQQSQSAQELQTTTLQVTTVLDGSTVVYTTMLSQESYEPAPVQTTTLVTTVLSGSILTLTMTVSAILYQTPTLQSGVATQTVSFVATRTTVIPSIATATETTSLTDVYTKTVSEVSTTTTTVTRTLDHPKSLNNSESYVRDTATATITLVSTELLPQLTLTTTLPTAIDNYNHSIPTAVQTSVVFSTIFLPSNVSQPETAGSLTFTPPVIQTSIVYSTIFVTGNDSQPGPTGMVSTSPPQSETAFVTFTPQPTTITSFISVTISPSSACPTLIANASTETLHTTELLTAQPQTFTLQGQNLTRTVTFTAPPETYTETLPAETRTFTLPPETTSILGPTVTATYTPSSSAASSSVRPSISGGVSLALASPTAIIGDLSGSSVDYDDVVSSEIELPFQVWLYSQSSANVRVSTNGVVGFTTLNNEFDNINLPYFGFSNCSDIPQEDGSGSDTCFTDTAALALWADLYIYNGTQQGIYYEITGTAPNRQVTFEFYESLYSDPTQSYHFLVHFLEASPNYVTFQYLNISDWGCTATVGVESLSGDSRYSQYSYLQGVIYPGLQITFNTNSGSNVYTVDAPGDSSGPAPACPSALGTI
ncbi:uracil-DNA glycosylase [Hortaea werneckii]|nr:uracil-DNA glycosylase [Hortaea werneckii]KAI6847792.1 uracil-DNA glycosylase [Hortaea werneckii]KAI6941875.1 uracil-DNA glycosylase [Hortaea werneckii]KAI6948323.1 uracil-DNA glycosylase [Hortaea werneckii]KAI6980278.1 uracil-DNA glycosylase [Hortaea werneckii]